MQLEEWQPLENQRHVRIELEDLAAGKTAQQVTLPEVREVEQDDPAAPGSLGDRAALDDQKQAYAWSVQLGAFSNREVTMHLPGIKESDFLDKYST